MDEFDFIEIYGRNNVKGVFGIINHILTDVKHQDEKQIEFVKHYFEAMGLRKDEIESALNLDKSISILENIKEDIYVFMGATGTYCFKYNGMVNRDMYTKYFITLMKVFDKEVEEFKTNFLLGAELSVSPDLSEL